MELFELELELELLLCVDFTLFICCNPIIDANENRRKLELVVVEPGAE